LVAKIKHACNGMDRQHRTTDLEELKWMRKSTKVGFANMKHACQYQLEFIQHYFLAMG
jgi:hypothetical protein